LSRISLAFGTFFSILSDGQFAARVQALRFGEQRANPRRGAGHPRPAPPPLREAAPDGALQLLGLLQRERASSTSSRRTSPPMPTPTSAPPRASSMKAAARCCATTSASSPVRDETEGSRVTLPAGFDAAAIRVTGNVVGKPPFTGSITHRGWRVSETRLPKLAGSHDLQASSPRRRWNYERAPAFSIGIDLGTTHCALSYVDIAACDGEQVVQQVLPIRS
jgi:hypothetical protein